MSSCSSRPALFKDIKIDEFSEYGLSSNDVIRTLKKYYNKGDSSLDFVSFLKNNGARCLQNEIGTETRCNFKWDVSNDLLSKEASIIVTINHHNNIIGSYAVTADVNGPFTDVAKRGGANIASTDEKKCSKNMTMMVPNLGYEYKIEKVITRCLDRK